jgi:hypothetical protein
VLGLLAAGRSGAQIADELVLSAETVRTHVRNAMSKLGATTRSHAVALALQGGDIGVGTMPAHANGGSPPDPFSAENSAALQGMVDGLMTLHDVDGCGVHLLEDDALSLRRVAVTETLRDELPALVALGDGTLGRAALKRRSQLCEQVVDSSRATLVAVPITADGRLLGVITVSTRISRPISRSELLLLEAFSSRVGQVLATGGDGSRPLARALERFRTSWSAASRVH